MLTELLRREKQAQIKPDADVDAFMKVRNKIENEFLEVPKRRLEVPKRSIEIAL